MDIFLEAGSKRAFASAVDWPGWARSGPDERAALATLLAYGTRYRRSMALRAPGFVVPATVDGFHVVERVEGNATTDFGAPGAIAKLDVRPPDPEELDTLIDLLRRAWDAFARTADEAEGQTLGPSGPRGGGRSLAKMRAHVVEADGAYVSGLGGRVNSARDWAALQQAFIDAAGARARGELPDVGPRGGRRWPARYAVRRSAWHALDHAWELEDRLTSADAQD